MPGFVRLNFCCARATLDEALARKARALEHRPRQALDHQR
jgi:bifunctional pyridoxal-dependent enzyme with beta-cystathionase and maltose regulon repressor activities